MSEDIKELLKASIERSKNWSKDGWKVTFGPNQYEVPSMEAAEELPKNFPYREEAVAYWKNVSGIAEEVTTYLEGALADIENGDLTAAENKLYFAQYYERPLEKYTQTSKPVYESLRNR